MAFSTLARQLQRDQTLQDAFLAFSEFAAKIRCGHTQANPFNRSKELRAALFGRRGSLISAGLGKAWS